MYGFTAVLHVVCPSCVAAPSSPRWQTDGWYLSRTTFHNTYINHNIDYMWDNSHFTHTTRFIQWRKWSGSGSLLQLGAPCNWTKQMAHYGETFTVTMSGMKFWVKVHRFTLMTSKCTFLLSVVISVLTELLGFMWSQHRDDVSNWFEFHTMVINNTISPLETCHFDLMIQAESLMVDPRLHLHHHLHLLRGNSISSFRCINPRGIFHITQGLIAKGICHYYLSLFTFHSVTVKQKKPIESGVLKKSSIYNLVRHHTQQQH